MIVDLTELFSQHMIRFRYLPFTWGKPKFQVCWTFSLSLFIQSKASLVSHNFTFFFYWRVRRLKKTRRPSCNRVLDFCEKLLPTTWLISAALARRGKRRSDQGPSEERCLLWSTTAQQFTPLGLSSQCWLFWFTVEKNNSYLRYEKYWSKLDSLPTWCCGVNMCPLIYFLFTIFSPCYGRACHIRIKEKKLFHVQKYYSPRAFLVSIEAQKRTWSKCSPI